MPAPVRDVTDTARWMAHRRALESERPDALFRDPFARRLAGERGERIATEMERGRSVPWSAAVRTALVDQIIEQVLAQGVDAVIDLAAGLDARPYWMALPAELHWYEVDLPEMIRDKEAVLAGERARCRVERVAMDLAAVEDRRTLLARIGAAHRQVAVVTEGLLIYLEREQAAGLAEDLAAAPNLRFWIADLQSPAMLRLMNRAWSAGMAAAPLRFAPVEGPSVFARQGWVVREALAMLESAAARRRIGLLARARARLARRSRGPLESYVCLWERARSGGRRAT